MKKLVILLVSLMYLLSLSACTKDSTPETLAGGWSEVTDSDLSHNYISMVEKAIEGTELSTKVPVKLLATQAVNGVNYKFLCEDGSELIIHEELDGTVYPLREDYSKVEKEDSCDNSKGCDISEGVNHTSSSKSVKEHYESLNGLTNASGKEHRTITISEDNVFVDISPDDLKEKIDNNEEFILFMSSNMCPWCRSVIESIDTISKEQGIEKIYTLENWDSEGKEIFRDKLSVSEDGTINVDIPGHETYYKLLSMDVNDFFSEFELTDKNEVKHPSGEKRIYLPTLLYIKDGEIKLMTTATSTHQENSRDELTEQILQDQRNMLEDFFSSTKSN